MLYLVCNISGIVKLAPVDNSRNVVQNQNIVLLCNVTQGTPTPTLQWLKGEYLIKYNILISDTSINTF